MRTQDAIGIGLSGLCLIHCLALPVLLSLAPALVWMEQEWVHLLLAGLALLVGLTAMRTWGRGVRSTLLRCLAAAGLGLLFYGALAEVPEWTERVLTVFGAGMLASAHMFAWKLTRSAHRAPH